MLGQGADVAREPVAAKQIVACMPGQPFDAKHAGGAAVSGGRFAVAACRGAA